MTKPSARELRIGGRVRRLSLLSVIAAVTAAFVPAGQGAGETLIATVGPGFGISLSRGDVAVTQLDAGSYTIQVSDKSDFHNFHLTGPGSLSRETGLDEIHDETWEVTFVNGVHTYLCDAHPSSMKKTFRVGAAPPVTTTPKLYATVGPTRTITLGKAAGKRTASVEEGKYVVVVRDRSKTDSFHLSGPGVNRKTGRAFTGSASWPVTLKAASAYRYWSDARPALKGTLKTS